MNNWINVKDRVPDSIANVILFSINNGVGIGYYDCYSCNPPEWKRYVRRLDTSNNLSPDVETCNVTHWTPLPKYPENIALEMYANEPCRICGRLLTYDDIESGAVFAGYSADNKSRAAHAVCWKNAMEIRK